MKNLSIILFCAGLLQACVLNLPDSIADMEREKVEATIDPPPYAASTQTWVYGSQIWSDRIVATPSNCTQTDNLSTSNEYKVYDGRYYYSWTCAYNNRNDFCPSPWRLPSLSDFRALNTNGLSFSLTLVDAWGYGGYAYGSSMYDVNSYAPYWSSTEDASNSGYAYGLWLFRVDLGVTVASKYNGQQVRCVK
jgi:hypothetical protein